MTGRFRNVAFDREGPIAWITMDRPERRNALSLEHLRELLECLRAVAIPCTSAMTGWGIAWMVSISSAQAANRSA
jgi:enoyl-CoA hydratase/carnithine racemase